MTPLAVRPAHCRTCGAAVVWIRSRTGTSMIVDAATVKPGETVYDPAAGHVSHFATCPDAARWRKRGKPEAPP